jgi:hypothetical protein
MIASGTFAHTDKEGDCRFCDFKRACGMAAEVEQIAGKLADSRLVHRARLATHD